MVSIRPRGTFYGIFFDSPLMAAEETTFSTLAHVSTEGLPARGIGAVASSPSLFIHSFGSRAFLALTESSKSSFSLVYYCDCDDEQILYTSENASIG